MLKQGITVSLQMTKESEVHLERRLTKQDLKQDEADLVMFGV